MLKIKTGILIKTNEIWFDNQNNYSTKNTRYMFMNMYDKPTTERYDKRATLINDLSLSSDDLQSHFTKECLYEIRRASKEDFTHVILEGRINNKEIYEFMNYYMKFNVLKKFSNKRVSQVRKRILIFRNNNCLLITKSVSGGIPLVHHVYVVDGTVARLLYSISLHNQKDGNSRKIGFANRQLHYLDMMHFKEKGFSKYDWGGVSSDIKMQGITKFKHEFGGQAQATYYYTLNEFWLKKFFNQVRNLINKFRSLISK